MPKRKVQTKQDLFSDFFDFFYQLPIHFIELMFSIFDIIALAINKIFFDDLNSQLMKDYNKFKSVIQNPKKHANNHNVLEMFVYFFFYTVLFSLFTEYPNFNFSKIDFTNPNSLEIFFQNVGKLYRQADFKKVMKNIIFPPTIFNKKISTTSLTNLAFQNFQFGTLLGTFFTIIFYMMSKFGFKMLFSPLGTYVSEFLIRIGFSKKNALSLKKYINQTLDNFDRIFDYISSFLILKKNVKELHSIVKNVLKDGIVNDTITYDFLGWFVAVMLGILGYTIFTIFFKIKELLKKDKQVILSDSIQGIQNLMKDVKKKIKNDQEQQKSDTKSTKKGKIKSLQKKKDFKKKRI